MKLIFLKFQKEKQTDSKWQDTSLADFMVDDEETPDLVK